MKTLRDNIYDVLSEHCKVTARRWRQNYVPCAAFASPEQELQGVVSYFFQAFSLLQGNFTHELSCIVCNSHDKDLWLEDFRRVLAPAFVQNARHIFSPAPKLDDNVNWLSQLLSG
jgi:hypothetical protein